MNREDKSIVTRHPVKKIGIKIDKLVYDEFAHFIVHTISTIEHVNLSILLKMSEDRFQAVKQAKWYLYHVKLDLEARGLIKAISTNTPLMRLELTNEGTKYFTI